MKNFLLLILLLPAVVFSQKWINEGAVWHYAWSDGGGFGGGFMKVNYEKDTLIQGNNCQKLNPLYYRFMSDQYHETHFTGTTSQTPQFTYSSGDTVFYFHHNTFSVLYNFGAKVNDTWDLGVDTNNLLCSKSIVQVDSIGFININNQNLRWIAVSPKDGSSVGFQGKILEKIGSIDNYLFPKANNCNINEMDESGYGDFNCFQDNSFSLYNVIGKDCEYLLNNEEITVTNQNISIFPTSAHNYFFIQNNNLNIGIENVQAMDIQGKEYAVTTNDNTYEINTLSNGMYFIKITLSTGDLSFHKLLKE